MTLKLEQAWPRDDDGTTDHYQTKKKDKEGTDNMASLCNEAIKLRQW